MARREARTSITASGADRLAEVAAEFGVPQAVVVSWMLLLETGGEDADVCLRRARMVASLIRDGYHDPTVRWGGLTGINYTAVKVPLPDVRDVWCPPYPGKPTWTLVTAAAPNLSPKSAISAPNKGEAQ